MAFRRAAKAAKIEVALSRSSPHGRFVAANARRGDSPVARLLGHKDLRMAARYRRLSPAFLADAVKSSMTRSVKDQFSTQERANDRRLQPLQACIRCIKTTSPRIVCLSEAVPDGRGSRLLDYMTGASVCRVAEIGEWNRHFLWIDPYRFWTFERILNLAKHPG
jgi:hypothetical protein